MSKARESSYKVKSAGIDKRVLRGYRRSLDWKQSRNELVSRRRNIQDASSVMSPLVEKSVRHESTKHANVTSSDTTKAVAESRHMMLLKWKEEKELKKKLQSMEQAKKKPFRVLHTVPELVPFKKDFVKLPKVSTITGNTTTATAIPGRQAVKDTTDNLAPAMGRQLRSSGRDPVIAAKPNVVDVKQKVQPGPSRDTVKAVKALNAVEKSAAALPVKSTTVSTLRQSRPQTVLAKETQKQKQLLQNVDRRTTRSQAMFATSSSASSVVENKTAKVPAPKPANLVNNKRQLVTHDGNESNHQKKPNLKPAPAVPSAAVFTGFQGVGNWSAKDDGNPKEGCTRRSVRLQKASAELDNELELFSKPQNSCSTCDQVVGVVGDGSFAETHELPAMNESEVTSSETAMEFEHEPSEKTTSTDLVPVEMLHVEVTEICESAGQSSRRSSVKVQSVPVESVSGCNLNSEEENDTGAHPSGTTKSEEPDINGGNLFQVSDDSQNLLNVEGSSQSMVATLGQKQAESNPVDSFVTPGRLLRSRSIASTICGSVHRTPRNFRNSLILRRMSPEEGVEILKQSPMIEMCRRRSVRLDAGQQGLNAAPMPSFDDIEVEDVTSGCLTAVDEPNIVSVPPSDNHSLPNTENQVDSCGDGAESDSVPKVKVEVSYFRGLLTTETQRMTALCETWRNTMEQLLELSEDVRGTIRTTVGQAELLMAQRFKQFSGLVDNCEFGTGEKEVTCTDLQGFWDMVYFQVEDVDRKFADLDRLKAADWVVEKPSPAKRKVVKKKVTTAATAQQKSATTVVARPNFAAFRRQMKQQQKSVSAEDGEDINQKAVPNVGNMAEHDSQQEVKGDVSKTETIPLVGIEMKSFDGGFFKVCSPVRQSPAFMASGKASSSRRSATYQDSPMLKSVLNRSVRKSLNTINASPSASTPCRTVPSICTLVPVTSNSSTSESSASCRRPLHSILHNSGSVKHDDVAVHEVEQTGPLMAATGRKTRKSVYFADSATPESNVIKNSSFLKYLEPTEISQLSVSGNISFVEATTPQSDQKTPSNVTPHLVDISGGDNDDDDDGDNFAQFGHLKVGFTPGVDGRSRRISGFSPPRTDGTPVNIMSTLDEENVNLMDFSPSDGVLLLSKARRSSTKKNLAVRRSRRVSSRLSLRSE